MKKIFIFFLSVGYLQSNVAAQPVSVGELLPSWLKGSMDIHHINTGRGNVTFCIFPDGTTMLIDAGELSPLDHRTFTPRNASIRPDSTKKPYEWITQYIKQVAPVKDKPVIDYALITHFHDDHFGAWYPAAPRSASGKYVLTGITGVADLLPVHTLIDRGWPGYSYPYDMKRYGSRYGGGEIEFDRTMQNYFSFLAEKQKQGTIISTLKAGSRAQIRLQSEPTLYPSFYVQNVKTNQWIWTGKDSSVLKHFPDPDSTATNTWPDENSLCLALAIHYGPFIYYTGGDNPGNVFLNDNPLRDVETPIARAVGEVDVATMDHHGNRDAVNEFMVKTLKPRVWIGQSWAADHPGHEVLLRMTSDYLYKGPRDLFSTNMLEANKNVIGPFIDRAYKSQQGHIVVRVMPGGNTYYIIILDDTRSDIPVKNVFGPYNSKARKITDRANK